MAYVDFDLRKAEHAFGLTENDRIDLFPNIEPIEPSDSLNELLAELTPIALGVNTEQARREYIISPILIEAMRRCAGKINVLPGIMLKVDEPKGLTGYCDYLIARSSKLYYLESPVVAVVEAKREDVLKVLDLRDLRPTEEQRAQVASSSDLAQLDQWFARSLNATSADEVFTG